MTGATPVWRATSMAATVVFIRTARAFIMSTEETSTAWSAVSGTLARRAPIGVYSDSKKV